MTQAPLGPENPRMDVEDGSYVAPTPEIIGADASLEISQELLGQSINTYIEFHNRTDRELRVGIFGDDIDRVLKDKRTICVAQKESAQQLIQPVLTPVENLEWFNEGLIGRIYFGEEVFVYLHPAHGDDIEKEQVKGVLTSALEEGKVIISEVYGDDSDSPIRALLTDIQNSGDFQIEPFGDGELASGVNFYNIEVTFDGVDEVRVPDNMYDAYQKMVKEGKVVYDPENGTALVDVIDGDEAEEIWRLYKEPFKKLGVNDPTLAGFDETSLKLILADPGTVKFVNRVDGKISTLLFFVNDFDKAPWFNPEKFRQKYDKFVRTGNALMFPGVVTDEDMQGNHYAQATCDLAIQVYARCGSNALMTFECTQISSTYIPALVKAAFEDSGVASITGTEEPVGSIEYYGIKKN